MIAEGTAEGFDVALDEASDPPAGAPDAGPGRGSRGPALFDFRRPNTFSRDHQRVLQIVAETFARQLSTVLSTTLRAVTHIAAGPIHQLTYGEYVATMPNPCYLAILTFAPLSGTGVMHLPLDISMVIVDRVLGGNGEGEHPKRPLTDIEAGLVSDIVARSLRELSYAFETLTELHAEVARQESNPQLAQVTAATEVVVAFQFDVRIGLSNSAISLCIPLATLQAPLESFTARANALHAGDEVSAALADRLLNVPVELRIRFGSIALSSSEVVELRVGDVLPLHHLTHVPLAGFVGTVPLLTVQPGRRGRRLAAVVIDPQETR